MNKQEMINKLTEALLAIEKNSCKVAMVRYYGFLQILEYDVAKNRKAYNETLIKGTIYLNPESNSFTLPEEFTAHLIRIAELSLIEDGPVEEMVTVKITESKAKELGLIA